jgi:ATP-binding cassette, subfamily B, bacterial
MRKKNNVLVRYLIDMKFQVIIMVCLSLLLGLIEIYVPLLTQNIIDLGIMQHNFQYVLATTLILICIYIVNSITSALLNVLFAKLSIKVVANVKKDIFSSLLRFPLSFFDKNKTGYIISRVEEVDSLNSLFSPALMHFFNSLFSFVGAFIVVLYMKWELLLVVLLFIPVLLIITNKTSSRILKNSKELNESAAEAQGEIHENINGLAELKNFNLEAKKEGEIKRYINLLASKFMKRNILTVVGNESITLFTMVSRCVFILMISYYIIIGELTLGSYFSLLVYISSIYKPVQMYSSISLSIQPALAVLSRINFFWDNETENESHDLIDVGSIQSIEFHDVTFSYLDNDKPILNHISFCLSKGKKLYIYGPNGSGKTTIAKLLLGFYTDYQGDILINGKPLKGVNIHKLRKEIGVVSQKAQLYSGSVLDNIKLWNEDFSDQEVYDILSEYGLSEILTDEKYKDMCITELGKNLSGGQVQEIALARAVLKQPSLFIFDEPTSNLDQFKKQKFIEILNRLSGRLCIIITHDEYLMSRADPEEDLVIDLSRIKMKLGTWNDAKV